tara:strand:- start:822 stop:1484 length:663 start_codon:yes stop_codon:yes gene_type:complete
MLDFRNIPPVTKYLLILNLIFFVLQNIIPVVNQDFTLHFFKSPNFEPYQLITHMFMHGGMSHLLFNMFGLFMFGPDVERMLGEKKFLTYYVLTGFGAVILRFIVIYLMNGDRIHDLESDFINNYISYKEYTNNYNGEFGSMVGASGALFGILAAFGYLFPDREMFLFQIKAKHFVMIYAAYELYRGLQDAPQDNIAHFAHLGGALFGYLILKNWRKKNIF